MKVVHANIKAAVEPVEEIAKLVDVEKRLGLEVGEKKNFEEKLLVHGHSIFGGEVGIKVAGAAGPLKQLKEAIRCFTRMPPPPPVLLPSSPLV